MLNFLIDNYLPLTGVVQGFFCALFFRRVLGLPLDLKRGWYKPLCTALGYAVILYAASLFADEPVRSVIGVVALSAFLALWTKTGFIQSLYVTSVAFLVAMAVRVLAATASGAAVYLAIGRSDTASKLLTIPVWIAAGAAVCNIKFVKRGFAFLFDRESKFRQPLIFTCTMVLLVYGILQTLSAVQPYQPAYRNIYVSFIAFFAIAAGFFLNYVRMAARERDNAARLLLEKDKLAGLNRILVKDNHDFSHWYPLLRGQMQSSLPAGAEADEFAREAESLYMENMREWYRNFRLPATGCLLIDNYLKSCRDNWLGDNIQVSVVVTDGLQYLDEEGVNVPSLLPVISNSVDNAYKALLGTDRENKRVSVEFGRSAETGDYEIMVFDNAREFDPGVLRALGRPGNTTNGTGYGFPNMIEKLERCGASLAVREWEYDHSGDEYTKCVLFAFDGRNKCYVDSYRLGRFPVKYADTDYKSAV